jgi:hypothetical protein
MSLKPLKPSKQKRNERPNRRNRTTAWLMLPPHLKQVVRDGAVHADELRDLAQLMSLNLA